MPPHGEHDAVVGAAEGREEHCPGVDEHQDRLAGEDHYEREREVHELVELQVVDAS